jgi:hypothetical protein
MIPKFTTGYVWLVVFVLGAVFQWWRGSKLDFVIYCSIAILLLMALQHKFHIPSIGKPRFIFSAWWLALSSCIFMFTVIHSTASTIASLLLLPLLASIIWQGEERVNASPSSARRFTSRFWTLLALILSLSELGNYFGSDFTGSDSKYPTLTVLVDPIVASASGRIGFVFLWSLTGIELLRGSIRK